MSREEALKVLDRGNAAKSVAETAMNRKSSRAHTVVKLHLEMNASDGSSKKSDIFVVDLAGRENEKTSQVTGERMKELICINKSLFHLSNCIQSLGGDGSKGCQGKRKASASDLAKAGISASPRAVTISFFACRPERRPTERPTTAESAPASPSESGAALAAINRSSTRARTRSRSEIRLYSSQRDSGRGSIPFNPSCTRANSTTWPR